MLMSTARSAVSPNTLSHGPLKPNANAPPTRGSRFVMTNVAIEPLMSGQNYLTLVVSLLLAATHQIEAQVLLT